MPILSHRVSDGPGATGAKTGVAAWVIVGLVALVLLLIGALVWRELAELHQEIRVACTGPAATLDLDSLAPLCRA